MSHETDRLRSIFGGIRGYTAWMKKVISINAHADSETGVYRLKVINYYRKFGLSATLAAFPVKRSTLFLWQKILKDNHGRLVSLIPKSTRPHRARTMQTQPLVFAEICRLRKAHYRLGKHKLFFLVKRYCLGVGIIFPQESTIGKIIKRNNLFYSRATFGYHDPARKRPDKIKKLRVNKAPKPNQGGYVEMDTVETIILGIRRYTITAIDVKLKVVYAQTFTTKKAANALAVLKTLAVMLPVAIHTVQTDNGSEFEAEFNRYCLKEKIKRFYTYPKCPKINGVIERFNRTIQEDCLDQYQDEMLELTLINMRIKEYLSFYHNDRIHESLADRTPADVIGYAINYGKSPICV